MSFYRTSAFLQAAVSSFILFAITGCLNMTKRTPQTAGASLETASAAASALSVGEVKGVVDTCYAVSVTALDGKGKASSSFNGQLLSIPPSSVGVFTDSACSNPVGKGVGFKAATASFFLSSAKAQTSTVEVSVGTLKASIPVTLVAGNPTGFSISALRTLQFYKGNFVAATVTTVDPVNESSVTKATSITITASGAFAVYENGQLQGSGKSVTLNLLTGQSKATFYVSATAVGSGTLTASASGFDTEKASLSAINPPNTVVLNPSSANYSVVTCGSATTSIVGDGSPVGMIEMSALSSTVTFFKDSQCLQSQSEFKAGDTVYFKNSSAETTSLIADATGAASAMVPINWSAASGIAIGLQANQKMISNACAPVSVGLTGAGQTTAMANKPVAFSLSASGSSQIKYYTDSSCSQLSSSATEVSGTVGSGPGPSVISMKVKGAGAITISAKSGSLIGSKTVQVMDSPVDPTTFVLKPNSTETHSDCGGVDFTTTSSTNPDLSFTPSVIQGTGTFFSDLTCHTPLATGATFSMPAGTKAIHFSFIPTSLGPVTLLLTDANNSLAVTSPTINNSSGAAVKITLSYSPNDFLGVYDTGVATVRDANGNPVVLSSTNPTPVSVSAPQTGGVPSLTFLDATGGSNPIVIDAGKTNAAFRILPGVVGPTSITIGVQSFTDTEPVTVATAPSFGVTATPDVLTAKAGDCVPVTFQATDPNKPDHPAVSLPGPTTIGFSTDSVVPKTTFGDSSCSTESNMVTLSTLGSGKAWVQSYLSQTIKISAQIGGGLLGTSSPIQIKAAAPAFVALNPGPNLIEGIISTAWSLVITDQYGNKANPDAAASVTLSDGKAGKFFLDPSGSPINGAFPIAVPVTYVYYQANDSGVFTLSAVVTNIDGSHTATLLTAHPNNPAPTITVQPSGQLVVDPQSDLVFSGLSTGSTVVQDVHFRNSGFTQVGQITPTVSSPWSLNSIGNCNAVLNPGDTCSIKVKADAAQANATLGLTYTDSTKVKTGSYPMSATILPTSLVTIAPYASGTASISAQLDGTSPQALFEVKNTGPVAASSLNYVAEKSFLKVNAGPIDSRISNIPLCATATVIPPNTSCVIGATLATDALLSDTSKITVTYNDGVHSQLASSSVVVSGTVTGPSALANLAVSLNAGSADPSTAAEVGSPAVNFTLQIANTGGSAASSIAIVLSDTQYLAFPGGAPACGTSLAAGASCNLGLILSTSSAVNKPLSVTVNYFNGRTTKFAVYTFTPNITVPQALVFSPAPGAGQAVPLVFTTEATVKVSSSFTITNPAFSRTGAIAITATFPAGTAFTLESFTCSTLGKGESCGGSFSFNPMAAGTYSGAATVSWTDSQGNPKSQPISLTGTATAPAYIAGDGSLPLSTMQGVAVSGGYLVKNTGGTTILGVSAALTGGNPGFSVADTSQCVNIAPNATCYIVIAYLGNDVGTYYNGVQLTYWDGKVTLKTGSIPISATVGSAFAIDKTTADVGGLALNQYATAAYTITNNSAADATVTTANDNGNFGFIGEVKNYVVKAHSAVTITMYFHPQSEGRLGTTVSFAMVGSVSNTIWATLYGTGVRALPNCSVSISGTPDNLHDRPNGERVDGQESNQVTFTVSCDQYNIGLADFGVNPGGREPITYANAHIDPNNPRVMYVDMKFGRRGPRTVYLVVWSLSGNVTLNYGINVTPAGLTFIYIGYRSSDGGDHLLTATKGEGAPGYAYGGDGFWLWNTKPPTGNPVQVNECLYHKGNQYTHWVSFGACGSGGYNSFDRTLGYTVVNPAGGVIPLYHSDKNNGGDSYYTASYADYYKSIHTYGFRDDGTIGQVPAP